MRGWTRLGVVDGRGNPDFWPDPGLASLRPAGSIAGITCLTSGSRSSRRPTWLGCWTRSIRKPRERVGPVAVSVPGKNKLLVTFLFSSCGAQPLLSLLCPGETSSFLPSLWVPHLSKNKSRHQGLRGHQVWGSPPLQLLWSLGGDSAHVPNPCCCPRLGWGEWELGLCGSCWNCGPAGTAACFG